MLIIWPHGSVVAWTARSMRNLLEGGCMEDVICAWHRRAHAFQTSDIADVEFYLVCNVREFRLILVAHVVLFLLVA